ncbi:MAG: FecR domain-containing protein, partial [Deltaproteobacteria bacterium]|nr:FecR domain-containing protein [Deltaproteobacteria bacterium]
MQRLLALTIVFLFTTVPVALAQEEGQEETVLVGRISHVEGELLRYVPEDEDWVATVKDTPVGKDDVFYAEEEVKAEFIIPNNTWIRIGKNAQIQIVKLEDDATEVDMDSGVARFYNKSSTTALKVITPYGHVTAPPHTTFDVYLGEESVEVIALKGRFNFIHVTDESEYEVIAGSSSLIAGYKEVTSGEGRGDEDWNAWNVKREALWKKRLEVKGDSSKYLPERLYYESHVLDENGAWERVYYDGGYRHFWRPMYVSSGWGPFTHGRWTVWYGDHCWVPYEPFGYVTHHYGNWVYIDSCRRWYWAPPVHRVSVGVGPFFHIGVGWYPGRVSWIHRGGYIGWIPLAPYESYYCRRYWGPRSVVVSNIHLVNARTHRHRNHAVVVKQKHFYGVDNYHKFRLTNIRGSSIVNSYRGAAVINSRVIRDFKKVKGRFNFRNIEVKRK